LAQRKQNIQNRTYITIRIHKRKNKNTQITKINKRIKIYVCIYKGNKPKTQQIQVHI